MAREPQTTRRALLAAGGATAAAVALGACGGDDGTRAAAAIPVPEGTGDLKILNYALLLEYIETDFYDAVVGSDLLSGRALDLAKRFGSNEQEHVDALTATVQQLGGTPPVKPRTRFELKDPRSVLALASDIEQLGAAAYLGQAASIARADVLGAALAIHSVEARHAAALNHLLGRPPVPSGPFAEPAAMDAVLRAVTPFLAPAR